MSGQQNDFQPDQAFAATDTLEEACEVREIVKKYSPWPVIYELQDGTYEVGGLTVMGGRLNEKIVEKIGVELRDYVKQLSYKDLDEKKWAHTIDVLKRN